MGNHIAGDLIAKFAAVFANQRGAGEKAIDLLDRAVAQAKAVPGFSPDAEFESSDPNDPRCVHPDFDSWRDPHPKAALGMLMVEAFAPNGLADLPRYQAMIGLTEGDEEAACDAWCAEVNKPFRSRYGLC